MTVPTFDPFTYFPTQMFCLDGIRTNQTKRIIKLVNETPKSSLSSGLFTYQRQKSLIVNPNSVINNIPAKT